MPVFRHPKIEVDISRDGYLVDTNVLYSAFHEGDFQHEDSLTFIRDLGISIYVPVSVAVETWGLLVGARKNLRGGRRFLAWITTPGNATLLPDLQSELNNISNLIRAYTRIDVVDGLLVAIASEISTQCKLNPPLPIATYDTADFLTLLSTARFRFQLYDLRSMEMLHI